MSVASELHRKAIIVDGLNTSNFSDDILHEMNAGGYTAVSCTMALWENFREAMQNIANWYQLIERNDDIVMQIDSVDDVRRAKKVGKTGIIFSWQNTSPLEDKIDHVALFKRLGVGIMQLTYNTQNYSGAGYIESNDSGLTGFGHEVVAEMNRVGVLCDLSHVGDMTAADAIAASNKPASFSHDQARSLKDVPRNKPDHLLKAVADKGGIVGVSIFTPGMPKGNDSTVEDYIASIEHMIDLVGEEHVGIGTDFSQAHARPGPFQEWASRDKGYARVLTPFGTAKILKPEGIRTIKEMPNVTETMLRAGWTEERILKVLGGNWMRVLDEVWSV